MGHGREPGSVGCALGIVIGPLWTFYKWPVRMTLEAPPSDICVVAKM